jgi:hypothetical protein
MYHACTGLTGLESMKRRERTLDTCPALHDARVIRLGRPRGHASADRTQEGRPLLGIHSNMPGVTPPDIDHAARSGAPTPPELFAGEILAYERPKFVYAKTSGLHTGWGCARRHFTGIAVSPIGPAAYLLDLDTRSYELIAHAFSRQPSECSWVCQPIIAGLIAF